jgi:L-alanine-DL-glutamate epimerase-like enolase superfamily enzyme
VSAFEVPTDAPESDGTLAWQSTVLVTVEIERGGEMGFGYTYADVSTARFIRTHLASFALGADPMDVGGTFATMGAAVRNLGRDGVAATAIAAVDMACWDLKARLLGQSFVRLLGAMRPEVPAYGSGGFTSYSLAELRRQLADWKEDGFAYVKMKIGSAPDTIDRVRAAREAVGDGVQLFVDANGAYAAREALHVAARLRPLGVTWFEEPVPADDLDGLRFVRERTPDGMAVAAGEYGYQARYFDRMLSGGCVDVLQADATRCGVSGFLAASTLCATRGFRLSAHCAPSVHAHLGCVCPAVEHVECFHDHTRLERMLFDGAVCARRGALRVDPSRPGLGLRLKRADAVAYRIFDEETDGA